MSQETWGRVLSELYRTIGQNNFTTWIEPLELKEVRDGVARIHAPTSFVGTWVERNYGDAILSRLISAGARDRKSVV